MGKDLKVDKLVSEGEETGRSGSERPRRVVRTMESLVASVTTQPASHPIIRKLEAQHITHILENSAARSQDAARQARADRWFRLVYVALGVGIFVFLSLLLLPDHSDLYSKVLQQLGSFLAGGAGGYGLSQYRSKR